ncbi:MAG: aminotransferase class V-fold PLP-dependent enzyme [Myxococcota bacterium]
MIPSVDIGALVEALANARVEALVGVPDSTLPQLGERFAATGARHIVAANEGGAVALASGLRRGGVRAAVYLQNTGLGIAIDAHGSLVGPDVLDAAVPWIVGWRGHPEVPDVAHHRWHGEYTEAMCHQAGLRVHRLPRDPAGIDDAVAEAYRRLDADGRSTALLVTPGTFTVPPRPQRDGFGRGDAIATLVRVIDPRARLVAGVGYVGRELASRRPEPADDVLAAGGMGHGISFALGLALAEPARPVVCIEGDGAALMHLGSAVVSAGRAPMNFVHVVLDNGCHESVGGTSTPWGRSDRAALGRALGYRRGVSVSDATQLEAALVDPRPGPALVHVEIEAHADPVPPRPGSRRDVATEPGSAVGPRLFTPGPGRLSLAAQRAMGREVGSRSEAQTQSTARVRRTLVEMVADDDYACVPLAGSATSALDAIVGSLLPTQRRIAVVVAGRYGARIAAMARRWGHEVVPVEVPRDRPVDPAVIDHALTAKPGLQWLAFVHAETSTGVLHPIESIAAVARRHGVAMAVDIVGSLGLTPIDLPALGIDVAFASAAKGLHGPAGLGLVFTRSSLLEAAPGGPSATLDLAAHWRRLEQDGQSPFTSATGAIRALDVALEELSAEGGPAARGAAYRRRSLAIVEGLSAVGVRPVVEAPHRMPLVLAMRCAEIPAATLIEGLRGQGIELYPAASDDPQQFRIGLVGVSDDDVPVLVDRITDALSP